MTYRDRQRLADI
jgi:uncharacterized protein with HEPN domain